MVLSSSTWVRKLHSFSFETLLDFTLEVCFHGNRRKKIEIFLVNIFFLLYKVFIIWLCFWSLIINTSGRLSTRNTWVEHFKRLIQLILEIIKKNHLIIVNGKWIDNNSKLTDCAKKRFSWFGVGWIDVGQINVNHWKRC